jgi:diguanylate cyclase (GGDEF)-like protein/PAS domain S-box-containing protein
MTWSPFDILAGHTDPLQDANAGIPPAGTSNYPSLLLVEDEPRALTSLYELLQGNSYDLTMAATGSEALLHLAKRRFDLVLLDLRLPDIDGNEVMDYINAKKIDVDVVVISGEVKINAAIGALQRGAKNYVRKPYSREQLLNTVGGVLGHRKLQKSRQRVAHALQNSERMYRYLVDASPDLIYTLNRDGRFTFVNDRVCQILGYTRAELIGKHYSFVVYADDLEHACHAFNERRADARASRNVELRLKFRPGMAHLPIFAHGTIRISLSATGMHASRHDNGQQEFIGTYGIARDVTGQRAAEEMIVHQAYHDALTNLPNRVLFKDRLGLALIQSERKRSELAVMFIDLDRFKLVNDTLGHVKGDELLRQVANRLKDCLRKGDTLARQGGDEFTVVLPDLRDRSDALSVADKFLERLQMPFDLDGSIAHISASIGIAIAPGDGDSVDDLLRNADIAMYHVKGSGKCGHAFFDPSMHNEAHQKMVLEQSLRMAIDRDELEMYYQPQVNADSGKIIGAEALMRWNHPVRGLLAPDDFLPLAEESGLVLPISEWMMRALCRDIVHWNSLGHNRLTLSLNLSPQYLDRDDFMERLRKTLTEHDVAPKQIEIEITENVCIRNPDRALQQLTKLEQLGVSVAIDDFGTGHSSMAYLHRFPVHTIKIDRSFVGQIRDEDGHYPVVLAIISISRGLSLKLVAEGVETVAQARYLRAHGCETMQGYLFHHPMPLERFVSLLHGEAGGNVENFHRRLQS